MKLTLLRHGETEGSQKNLYYGAADIPALPKSLEALQIFYPSRNISGIR